MSFLLATVSTPHGRARVEGPILHQSHRTDLFYSPFFLLQKLQAGDVSVPIMDARSISPFQGGEAPKVPEAACALPQYPHNQEGFLENSSLSPIVPSPAPSRQGLSWGLFSSRY